MASSSSDQHLSFLSHRKLLKQHAFQIFENPRSASTRSIFLDLIDDQIHTFHFDDAAVTFQLMQLLTPKDDALAEREQITLKGLSAQQSPPIFSHQEFRQEPAAHTVRFLIQLDTQPIPLKISLLQNILSILPCEVNSLIQLGSIYQTASRYVFYIYFNNYFIYCYHYL